MNNKPLISAVINTRNEAKTLEKCLKSVKNFAQEIIVVDMESTDGSLDIAKKYKAKIYNHKFLPVVEPARNYALSKATGKWIILLDPDEYLTLTLKKELKSITKRHDVDFVKIPRQNFIFGKWMRHSKCWPDYLIRFFKKSNVTWKNEIHSQPETKGSCLTLLDCEKLAIKHNNYPNVSSFITRALRYSDIQAEELLKEDYKVKTSDFILKPTQEFNSRFFYAQGYKDGLHGLIFSLLQAFTIGLIYIKLWEKQGSQEKVLAKESFISASQESNFEYSHWFTQYFIAEYSHNIFKNFIIKIRHILNRISKNF
jgi:(heptosyl)LPS beta-1,4-glucosyltransferase